MSQPVAARGIPSKNIFFNRKVLNQRGVDCPLVREPEGQKRKEKRVMVYNDYWDTNYLHRSLCFYSHAGNRKGMNYGCR
jgi:hypothetical protein